MTGQICLEKNTPRPDQLFIKEDATPFTTHQLRQSVTDIIFRADSLASPASTSFHSVWKVSSTQLDYRGFSLNQIMNKMKWKSSQTYLKYYCKPGLIEPSSQGGIIAGSKLPST